MYGIYFKYASEGEKCSECDERIQGEDLTVTCKGLYHFECFFNNCYVDMCRKSDIMIVLENEPEKARRRKAAFVSLEDYDKNPGAYHLVISSTDLSKIRESIALSEEHKTPYFIPSVSETSQVKCPKQCCLRDSSRSFAEELHLDFEDMRYHPECLSKIGKVNVDAKEIIGYNSLNLDEKELLDKLFKKDDAAYCHPVAEIAVAINDENCSFPKCFNNGFKYKIHGLRIRYKTKPYHPKCFAAMEKVNVDAEEIGNYGSLGENNRTVLRRLFKKSNQFDIPSIESADEDDYCTLPHCLFAYGALSKFPYPYTITARDRLQIKFHGNIYHLECFASAGIVNMNVKHFRGYNDLYGDEKQVIDRSFMLTRSVTAGTNADENNDSGFDITINSVSNTARMSGIHLEDSGVNNAVEEPPTKKRRMEIQMHDATESRNQEEPFDENGNNDYQEPSDGIRGQETIDRQQNTGGDLNNVLNELENESSEQVEVKQEPRIDSHSYITFLYKVDEESETIGEQQVSVEPRGQETEDRVAENSANDGNGNSNYHELFNRMNVQESRIAQEETEETLIQSKNAENGDGNGNLENGRKVNQEANGVSQISYQFMAPHEDFIRSTLKKLKIPFTREAFHFWADVLYTEVLATASPGTTFDISSSDDSFFKCLSCFFTGNENRYFYIKAAIQAYLFNNFKSFEVIDGIDFSSLDKSPAEFQKFYQCSTLTNVHFTFICSWLKCRIGIYSDGRLSEKYGNGKEENDPIFLIDNQNFFYKPVLSLM